jgi:hypothetical protein
VWLRGVHVQNKNDSERAFHFRKQAECCLLHGNHIIDASPALVKPFGRIWWFGFLSNWATLFQTLSTAVLITAGCIVTRIHPMH